MRLTKIKIAKAYSKCQLGIHSIVRLCFVDMNDRLRIYQGLAVVGKMVGHWPLNCLLLLHAVSARKTVTHIYDLTGLTLDHAAD